MRFLAPGGARNDQENEDIIWRGINGQESFAGTIKPRNNKQKMVVIPSVARKLKKRINYQLKK